jgi:hypothetical protein
MTLNNEVTTDSVQRPTTQIRYCYLKDPKKPERILTIGRQLVGENKVQWTYCINNPIDKFQKKRAHSIIEGRIAKNKDVICKYPEGIRPIHHVVEAIATNMFGQDPLASRIAKAHLPEFQKISERKKQLAQPPTTVTKKKVPSARAKSQPKK